jgi:hypothetical protein
MNMRKHAILIASLLAATPVTYAGQDLIEAPRNTNGLFSAGVPSAGLRAGSNALKPMVLSAGLSLASPRTTTNYWFSPAPPIRALSTPGTEWAERTNAQTMRQEREQWK